MRFCWGSQRRYPVWTIHDNVTILVTLKASNVRAISLYMSLFLALEAVIIFIGHHVDCGRWNNCGCELLYSIKLVNFGHCINECLWSFLIDVGSQTMGILPILMVAASFIKLYLLASILNWWTYTARNSFSHCWISTKHEV